MDALYGVYDRAQQFYNTIQPFIPQSIAYTFQHFYAQSSRLLYTLITSPYDIQNEIPAILSTLALAVSLYWTITSTFRAMRTTFNVVVFVLKYGTIAATILGLVGLIYPNQDRGMGGGALANSSALGSIGRAIILGWHALTQSTNENQHASPYRRSKGGTRSQRRKRKGRYNPRAKFDSYTPPSTNTRSKAKKQSNSGPKGPESNSRSSQDGKSPWWQEGKTDAEQPLTSKIINWALQRTWDYGGLSDWSNLGVELPESIRNSWDEFKVAFTGVPQEHLDDDAENASHVR